MLSLVRSGACELGLLGSAAPVRPAGLDVLHVEDQPFVVVAVPGGVIEDDVTIRPGDLAGQKLIASRTGSLMRGIVDDITAGGTGTEIVTVVDHRTSILPLVLTGVGVAVLPSSWTRLARRCGAVVAPIEPTAQLHVAMVSLPAHLTPAARAFLALTGSLARRRAAHDA
ncbi:LysR family transcriptional regulator substrate-binding protein [Streptomyces sp. CA-179760]|uniref:LysR family transcriptional regulator substrate-binding protein n=1 Tax=Streptomyces sp. CA-179760 TaxID=3240054 RepID=UPI003D8B51CC